MPICNLGAFLLKLLLEFSLKLRESKILLYEDVNLIFKLPFIDVDNEETSRTSFDVNSPFKVGPHSDPSR